MIGARCISPKTIILRVKYFIQHMQQILFRDAKSVGCAEVFCPRLPFAADRFASSASFLACKFDTAYFEQKSNTRTICSDKDGASNCPEDAKNCLSITSQHTRVKFRSGVISSICCKFILMFKLQCCFK